MTEYYPDADPETTSVDGYTMRTFGTGFGEAWADIQDSAGNWSEDDGNFGRAIISSDIVEDKYNVLGRGIIVFDVSGAQGLQVDSARVKLYGGSSKTFSGNSPAYTLYSANPSSNTALASGDYTTLGTTELATPKAAPITGSQYNTWELNSDGIAHLQAALDTGSVVKFGVRESEYDAKDVEPTYESNKTMYYQFSTAEVAAEKPILEINGADWLPWVIVI